MQGTESKGMNMQRNIELANDMTPKKESEYYLLWAWNVLQTTIWGQKCDLQK